MKNIMHNRILIRFLLLALLVLLPATVYAQDDISDDEVNEVAKDLYCPVCESTPLDVCPTQACADWRELIRTKLAAGETRQDVLEYFARQYGDGVLADPPRRGACARRRLTPAIETRPRTGQGRAVPGGV